MEQIRRWFYRPKKDDKSLLAQFFYADEALNLIANELDSFDGRKDPERCTTLVNQLRQSQDKVLTITNAIMDVLISDERANRDFRVKFPEDVLQENLAGQLWFGAECLAAGSSIMNREAESTAMRPLAKAVTKSLDNVRNLLRDTCLRNNTPNGPIKLDSNELFTEMLLESLKIFDKLFADFELAYVSAMVPVKTTQEYELQELIGVLFSETLQRALKMKLLTQEMVDDCDPALMFTIPRLAIVSGLFSFPSGPLCIDKPVEEMSEMFRPFRTLLLKIRELLWTLNKRELFMLEKLLCDNEQISDVKSFSDVNVHSDLDDFVNQFYSDYPLCKDYVSNFYTVSVHNGQQDAELIDEVKDSKSDQNINRNLVETYENQRNSAGVDIPSTSGYLIPNTVSHDTLLAAITNPQHRIERVESPPDHDCLEVISVAAATLSSILTTNEQSNDHSTSTKNTNLESPNDSGISTENTSLDRSPSLDLNESKQCNCGGNASSIVCSCYPKEITTAQNSVRDRGKKVFLSQDFSPGTSKLIPKHVMPVRKKCIILKAGEVVKDDDSCSVGSSDTSSFNSNCVDDEEIALAMQAAEIASRNEVRAKYSSSEDLIHRLFVCIAGVADQLQTNFASDLRNILKSVFLINASDSNADSESVYETPPSLETSIEYHPTENEVIENNEFSVDPNILAQEALFDTNVYFHLDSENSENEDYTNHPRLTQEDDDTVTMLCEGLNRLREDVANLSQPVVVQQTHSNGSTLLTCPREQSNNCERPPIWIPDIEAPKCMSCEVNFTVVKRRHHCRNCGKVFCSRCSSNSVPLPKFGHTKPVRVCNKCFLYNLAPFTM